MKKKNIHQLTAKLIKPQEKLFHYLPNPDEIEAENGIQIYRQMMLDPRIFSLINLIKSRCLHYPIHIVAHGCNDQIVEACRNAGFETQYYDDLEQILSSLIYGHSVNECVWKEEGERFLLESIQALNPQDIRYDENFKPLFLKNGELSYLDHAYKWIVMRHGSSIQNPYGESLLKACYWPWKFKQAGLEFWLKATEKFSVPSILALFETQGSEDEVRRRAQNLADMLGNLHAGSGAALANVKQVESLQASGSLAEFRSLCEFCDQQISYALTGQSLATGDASHNARAASQTHGEILDFQCRNIAKQLESHLQLAMSWFVQLNFGKQTIVPKIQFNFEQRRNLSFDDYLRLLEREVPFDKESLYDLFQIKRP
ncbi:MAG: phage portal protein family protein [Spirochaetia bacterium]